MDRELSLEDLNKLNREQFHQLWFNEAKSYRQIAKMYNCTRAEVKLKKKELGLGYISSGFLKVANKARYGNDKSKVPR